MYYHKIFIIVALSTFLFYQSCATSYAPSDWLPGTDDVATETYGGWITLTAATLDNKLFEYSGELIAIDTNSVYILYDSLYQLPKNCIHSSVLEIDERNTPEYSLWVIGGTLSTISNGKFLLITAPLWLLLGIPATVGESFRDYYESEQPDTNYWESITKFARFPQGLPPDAVNKLKAKVIAEE